MAYEKLPLNTGEIITEEALAHIQTQADEANAYTDQKISEIPDPPPPPVTSVNSKTGAVVLKAEDIGIDDAGGNFTATDVEGALSELFTSVSDGKTLIAGAITDKNVPTSPSDTFQTMADNIGMLNPYIPPDDTSDSPGNKHLIAGTMDAGFFGEVPASELITGSALSSAIGLSAGTLQHSNEPWLKFAYEGKIQFVAKKTLRHSLSWDNINAADAVYGSKTIQVGGLTYRIRLMRGALTDPSKYDDPDRGAKGSEWNKLMLPIHEEAIDKSWAYPAYVEDDVPVWSHGLGSGAGGMYTDADLLTHGDHGSGAYSWCQETRDTNTATRVGRGRYGVSHSGSATSSHPLHGFRPVLELVQ